MSKCESGLCHFVSCVNTSWVWLLNRKWEWLLVLKVGLGIRCLSYVHGLQSAWFSAEASATIMVMPN